MRSKFPSAGKEYATDHKRAYYSANPEKRAARLAKQKAWYEANKVRVLAEMKVNRDKNKATLSAKRKLRYQANKPKHSARKKAYYYAHRKEMILKTREWQKANRERLNTTRRIRYENPECPRKGHVKAYGRKRIESGKAKTYAKQFNARNCQGLTDFYIRQQLAKRSSLKASEIPQVLVEAKRLQLAIKRHLKT